MVWKQPGDPYPEDHVQTNTYTCPTCNYSWQDVWSCGCDDECPNCGESDISPTESEDDPDCDCSMCKFNAYVEVGSYTWGKPMSELMTSRLVKDSDDSHLTPEMRNGKDPSGLFLAWLRS